MVTYPFNMIDMGGIDLAEIRFGKIDGIYDSIVEALNNLGEVVIYNWKFGEVLIAPGYYEVIEDSNGLLIGGVVRVTEDDRVGVEGIEPVFGELSVTENGVYIPEAADGFSKVTVTVPNSVTELSVLQNGEYLPQSPNIGFSKVSVTVPNLVTSLSVSENGVYVPQDPYIGYSQVDVEVASGSASREVPVNLNIHNGYISGGSFYYDPSSGAYSDVYEAQYNHYYLFCAGENHGNRFRVMYSSINPANWQTPGTITGTNLANADSPSADTYGIYKVNSVGGGYITIGKTNENNPNLSSYLWDLTSLGILPSGGV